MAHEIDRTCRWCGKVVAPDRKRFCNHCGELLVDEEQVHKTRIGDLFATAGDVVVRDYPGRQQADAAKLYEQEAGIARSHGFVPVAQSWGEGRSGVARMALLGTFAGVARPRGSLTVTYHRITEGALAVEQVDRADQIRKLAELRDAGIVTTEEFETKKADLLSRM